MKAPSTYSIVCEESTKRIKHHLEAYWNNKVGIKDGITCKTQTYKKKQVIKQMFFYMILKCNKESKL